MNLVVYFTRNDIPCSEEASGTSASRENVEPDAGITQAGNSLISTGQAHHLSRFLAKS